jgi:hypothetical protein
MFLFDSEGYIDCLTLIGLEGPKSTAISLRSIPFLPSWFYDYV